MTPFGTWLHVAAKAGHVDLAGDLIQRGLDVNRRGGTFDGSPLNLAASAGHLPVIQLLLESGAEMDVSEPERNPLFGAIYGGHLEVAKLLVVRGIDYRVRYTGGTMTNMDAEAFARERGEEEIAAYLASLRT
jgi:ankyrin repeat protein